jgi:hypothetical protein
MILLVTLAPSAPDCANRIHQSIGKPVTIARGFSDALAHLRTSNCDIVILDQNLLEAETHEVATFWAHLEMATVIELNLALTGPDRLIREVQSARKRWECNQAAARESAKRLLRSEIDQTLTALLLDCALAAEIIGLPSSAAERIASIRIDAEKLRLQLTPPCTN